MAIFPKWNAITASSGAGGATWANILISNIIAAQAQIASVIQTENSLNNYIRLTLDKTGKISSVGYSHEFLSNVSASQHHNRLHGSAHVNNTDNIATASATHYGLMSPAQLSKLNNMVTGATENHVVGSVYIGNGSTLIVTLGFQPSWVKIIQASSAVYMAEYVKQFEYVFTHLNGSIYSHIRITANTLVSTNTTKMFLKGNVNTNNIKYRYIAFQ